MSLVGVHVRAHINIIQVHESGRWLRFTSHGHGDIEPIMRTCDGDHLFGPTRLWDTASMVYTLFYHQYVSSSNVYDMSLDLRLSYILGMSSYWHWSCQTLLGNTIIINVAFGSVVRHAARHGQPRKDFTPPVNQRDIHWALPSDQIQKMHGHVN